MTTLWKNQSFKIAHADAGQFEGQGARPLFEYRQLGIPEATQGKFGMQVIRAMPGMESPAEWHSHDLEVLEIVSPANFDSQGDAAP